MIVAEEEEMRIEWDITKLQAGSIQRRQRSACTMAIGLSFSFHN
jgi:hypothetical protein